MGTSRYSLSPRIFPIDTTSGFWIHGQATRPPLCLIPRMPNTSPLWSPSAERCDDSLMNRFMRKAGFADYASLWRWSIEQPEEFWRAVWDDGEVIGEAGSVVVRDFGKMPGAQWFPEAQLNYAENVLRGRGDGDALVFWGEDKVKRRLSHDGLYREVARLAAALRAEGVRMGDRVAAYLPNMPEAIIALLAASSIGAVFSSASPDFGVQGVLDRFGQIEPKILIAVDGYFYNGKALDIRDKVAEIAAKLPSVKRVVVKGYLEDKPDIAAIRDAVGYEALTEPFAAVDSIAFEQLPFEHPLYILYSSGTTGVPKCIVHCVGGVLLQHLKEHRLHSDIRPGDRLFYFTTLGWMMWNWLASGLASGATLLLYDGSPFVKGGHILFDYAAAERCTHFGVGAKYLDACLKLGTVKPRETHDLKALRCIFSTGSPLSPDGFDYVYRDIKPDVQLASISGGTDIVSCFVLGNPLLPVWKGEIQGRGLGLAVEVLDDDGKPVRGEKGELACMKPFPVMPIGFWNDPDGKKYRAAYFERFPNIWCHGDFAEITEHDGVIIHGRSDATLKPGGVRIGTAEIYRQVEKLDEVVESVAVGQEWESDTRVVLFVKLREGLTLDEALAEKIRQVIRANTTPRHVPAKILQVADIPRTKSGKIVELAVREAVHDRPVKNIEALANPEALDCFRGREELRT